MANKIKVKRGLEANRTSFTPEQGELVYTTDDKQLFVGDGSTAGGTAVSIPPQFELIATAAASATTNVDFTDLSSDYAEYMLVVRDFYGSSIATMSMYTSSDNGVSYDSSSGNYKFGTLIADNVTVSCTTSSATSIGLGSIITDTRGAFLTMRMFNAGVATEFRFDILYAYYISNSTQRRITGRRDSKSAVNAIRITAGADNINGTFYLYGAKAS